MTYRGTVKNGTVVFEDPTALQDGETVDVTPVRLRPDLDLRHTELQNAMARLAENCPDLPKDIAENHDHYLYGTPKNTEV